MSLSDLFRSSRHQQSSKDNASVGQALTSTADGAGPLSRSSSFGGVLASNQHRRSFSATYTLINDNAKSGSTGCLSGSSSASNIVKSGSSSTLSKAGGVLGVNHSPNSSLRLLQGFSSTWGAKSPPMPRPFRTMEMFAAIEKGLKDCCSMTQTDISNLKSTLDSLSIISTQQLKGAERYYKKLECQLSKLEELQENYDVQQRLHDGARTMGHAFVLHSGREREMALQSVRSGLQECTDVLCNIEMELERMMGTLMFQIKGIQGFARLCVNDVFEITIRYGDQKWKTRGRIMKDDKQIWDNPRAIFKALLGEMLLIKAIEIKTLAKNVALGHKYCETKDLFASTPQMMSVNLNTFGSLKLHLIVTWNPLHGRSDEVKVQKPPSLFSVLQSPLSKQAATMSPPSVLPEQVLTEKPLRAKTSIPPTNLTLTAPSDDSSLSHVNFLEEHRSPLLSSQLLSPQEKTLSTDKEDESSDCCSLDRESYFGSEIPEIVHSLLSSLEDIQGQYPELHSLVSHLAELDEILRHKGGNSRKGSTGSGVSISVESALGCFDFLNSAIESDDNESLHERNLVTEESQNLDPEMTAKTSDSGVASLARQLVYTKEKSPSSREALTPTLGATTGFKLLDQAIYTHISYCQRLVSHLGSFGPLKCREIFSLDKLRRQAFILGKLIELLNKDESDSAKSVNGIKSLNGAELLPEGGEGRRLWTMMTGNGEPVCMPGKKLLEPLQKLVQPLLEDQNAPVSALSVAKLLLCRVVDADRFDPEMIVSVLQWQLYLSQGIASFSLAIQTLTEEAWMIEALHSPDLLLVKKSLALMQQKLFPSECLLTVCQLLIYGEDAGLLKAAETYVREVLKKPEMKKEVVSIFLEGLESENPLTRQGACAALTIAGATEFIDQLVFLCYADNSGKVRQQAKDALFSFGVEGQKAFEQAQLCNHGFQGLGLY